MTRPLNQLLSADHLLSDGALVVVEHALADDEVPTLIASVMAAKPTTLDLRGNQIGDAGAQALAEMLTVPSCPVVSLRLWGNRIGIPGLAALSAALTHNSSLAELDLGKQQTEGGDACAQLFATALHANATLQKLDLRYCGISSAGATSLAAALPSTSSLRHLDLRYNAIGLEGAEALAVGLSRNETPLRVWVKANKYDDRDAAALAEFLESDATLAPLAAGQERLWF